MSTVICQSFQSCLEPLNLELKVSCNQSHIFPPHTLVWGNKYSRMSESDIENHNNKCRDYKEDVNNNTNNKDNNSDCWSFITTKAPTKEGEEQKETTYVHPLVKRATSTLSEKSLELCTENLGCETGTNISDDMSDYFSSSESESGRSSPIREKTNLLQHFSMNEKVNRRSFPPPLSSISTTDCVQYRPHREGGRLVIKAVSVASSTTCFQAQRDNGRLRLLFQRNYDSSCESEQEDIEDEVKEEEEDGEEQIEDEVKEEEEDGEEQIEDEVEEEEQIEEEGNGCLEEEIHGTRGNCRDAMGLRNFQRPNRCKEGGNRPLSSWEHFWVAT